MKSFVAVCIIFAIMLACVILNCLYINRTADTLTDMVASLPRADSDDCRDAVEQLDSYWRERHDTVALSVSFVELNRISDVLSTLKSYAASGATSDFECARGLLLNAIRELRRLESFELGSLL